MTLLQLVGVPCKEIVKPNPETQDFAAILDRVCAACRARRLFLSVCCARWKKARYSTEETGHFGLALSDYSHYTSPIRRYRIRPFTACFPHLWKACRRRGAPPLRAVLRDLCDGILPQ